MCERKGLPTKCVDTKVKYGWVGKQKGAFQLLFERGWINPLQLGLYTEHGRKGDEAGGHLTGSSTGGDVGGDVCVGGVDPTGCNYSIKEIMKLQRDFIEEETLLQYHGKQMGVCIDRTPKCHPELAGKGIEYAWAFAKLFYRKSPISEKRTKNMFQKLVEESTSTKVLPLHKIRACSRKARTYYEALQSNGES